jgi:hypothetical protein
MSGEEQGRSDGEEHREEQRPAPQGGLGIMFLAAALALALVLTAIGVVAYFAMKQ